MRVQVRDQGRHLGGRPPYGYRLVDAGPHPNAVHAGWGRRLLRLDPDPVTAPHVRWMFAQRLAGHSCADIARTLNRRGIPAPSALDLDHNTCTGARWSVRTVATILANPRYTGRQVWNRHSIDHQEALPGDKHTSAGPVRRANPTTDWVISTHAAHPALVSEADFVRVQQIRATPVPQDGSIRRYRLTGLVVCTSCGRRAEGHWVHGRAGYRCRHGQATGAGRPQGAARPWYIREDRLLQHAGKHFDVVVADAQETAYEKISARLRARKMTFAYDGNDVVLRGLGHSRPATPPRRLATPHHRPLRKPATRANISTAGLPKRAGKRPNNRRRKCRCGPLKLRPLFRRNPRRV